VISNSPQAVPTASSTHRSLTTCVPGHGSGLCTKLELLNGVMGLGPTDDKHDGTTIRHFCRAVTSRLLPLKPKECVRLLCLSEVLGEPTLPYHQK